jgi:peptide/nickel transport system substrate-binding protein
MDVVYTIDKIRDPGLEIKSPRRASWEGIDVVATDDRTVVFTLKQPYAPFLENASIGILPKHIWGNIANNEFDVSYYNLDPIGTGPYRIAKIVQDDKKGLPLSYEFKAFPGYALGEPYITTFTIRFFGNNKDLLQAYQDGLVTQFPTVDPEVATAIESAGGTITRMHLPLIDAAFFNQNQQPIFVENKVRRALAMAIDKDRIVHDVLYGYGVRADGPISALSPRSAIIASATTSPFDQTLARELLGEVGYVPDAETGILTKTDKKTKKSSTLSFSITVPDVPELRHAAEMKENWDALGARTSVKVFETGTFGGEVLAPRAYDVLVYGIIGKASDPYPYWHSSQRNSPGANIANYTNRVADDLLEKIRREGDPGVRTGYLEKLEQTILEDMPAVFIYSPNFLYATDPSVKGITAAHVLVESDRFNGIHDWYIDVDRVWWFLEPFAKRVPEPESRISLILWKYISQPRL